MRTSLRRAATLAVASAAVVAGATAVATPATAATVTVPGCFGVAVIYCDPTVEYVLPYGVTTTPSSVPVCAGTCVDVPVPMPTLVSGTSPRICVTAENRAGATVVNECVPLAVTPPRPAASVCRSWDDTPGITIYDRNTGDTIVSTCY